MANTDDKKASQNTADENAKKPNSPQKDEKTAEFRRTLEDKKKEARLHLLDFELKDQFRQF